MKLITTPTILCHVLACDQHVILYFLLLEERPHHICPASENCHGRINDDVTFPVGGEEWWN